MAGEGHVFDMINRYKQNRAAMNQRRERNSKNELYSKGTSKLKFKEVSKEELEKIKKEIREKVAKEKKQKLILSVIFTSIALFLIYSILFLR